jgi:hypothetical protein
MARLDTKSINDCKLIQTPHDHSQYINEGKPLMKWHNVHTAMRGHTHGDNKVHMTSRCSHVFFVIIHHYMNAIYL